MTFANDEKTSDATFIIYSRTDFGSIYDCFSEKRYVSTIKFEDDAVQSLQYDSETNEFIVERLHENIINDHVYFSTEIDRYSSDKVTWTTDAETIFEGTLKQTKTSLVDKIDTVRKVAISTVVYDPETGKIQFKTIDDSAVQEFDLIQMSMLSNVELINENDIQFTFRLADDSSKTVTFSLDTILSSSWTVEISDKLDEMKLSVPPTTKAVIDYAVSKIEGKSIQNDVNSLRKQVDILTMVSENKLYKQTQVDLVSNEHSAEIQVGNALPTGIWTGLPSWSYSVYLNFDCLNAVHQNGIKVESTLNSFVFPRGTAWYVKIPVNILGGSSCRVYCDGINSAGEHVSKYNFFDENDALIFSSNIRTGEVSTIPSNLSAKFLVLYKDASSTPLQFDLEVKNLRVYATNSRAQREICSANVRDEVYPNVFTLLPSAVVSTSEEGISTDCSFEYIEKLPREGV
jgi:hypothetical protein